jgi:hypothetical protein
MNLILISIWLDAILFTPRYHPKNKQYIILMAITQLTWQWTTSLSFFKRLLVWWLCATPKCLTLTPTIEPNCEKKIKLNFSWILSDENLPNFFNISPQKIYTPQKLPNVPRGQPNFLSNFSFDSVDLSFLNIQYSITRVS